MNVLSIDTCFPACAVGVVAGDQAWAQTAPMTRGQAEHLIPLVMETLDTAGLQVRDLHLIVVNVGPGSFTGVRLGIAAARGLALPFDIPVQGVVSFDALRAHAGPGAARTVRIDTGRQDFFAYDFTDAPAAFCDPMRIQIAALRGPEDLTEQAIFTDRALPYAVNLARLGARVFADKSAPTHGRADPIYIREAETTTAKALKTAE